MLLRFLGRRPSDGGLSLCKVGARAGGPAGAFGCAIGPAVRRRRDFPCRFRGVSGLFGKVLFLFLGYLSEFSECSTPASFSVWRFSVGMVTSGLLPLLEAAMILAAPDLTAYHRALKMALRAYAPRPFWRPFR